MLITFDEPHFLIGLGILCILLSVLWWQKRSLSYLFFFSIFWVYLLVVVKVIIFPIVIDPHYSNDVFIANINLRPFYFGNCSIPDLCIKSVFENIILTMPFGFGINFLVRIRPRNFIWLALSVGFVFELSQLIISVVFGSEFRIIDINDVILNGMGVVLGYVLFRVFAWVCLKVVEYFGITPKWLFAYVYALCIEVTDQTH